MCGIAGLWRPSASGNASRDAAAMADTLIHRGPNAGDAWADEEVGIALSHRRLAIIELSRLGAQPMASSCSRYILSYNGEIYNHLALRAELDTAKMTPQWRGSSDTETLLACFAAWGIERTLKAASGMFALALWDRQEHALHLARDRFGEKPLYYGHVGCGEARAFVFGSELKALKALPGFDNPVDRDAVALFMRFCYVPAPYCIYAGISKLEPGKVLTLDSNGVRCGDTRLSTYWSATDVALAGLANPLPDDADTLDRLESALSAAVGRQSMSDVPVGAFLSGGVDSSMIAALLQAHSTRPVSTFTIGFDEARFDEAPHAAAVAKHLGTNHHETRVRASEARDLIPDLPHIYDEPFADSSQLPTIIISRVAREQVTVALSGDAGDELFGGYNRHLKAPRLWEMTSCIPKPVRKHLPTVLDATLEGFERLKISKMLSDRFSENTTKLSDRLRRAYSIDTLYSALVSEWSADSVPVLSNKIGQTSADETEKWRDLIKEPEHRMMLMDTISYLPGDILCKVDRASMSKSLETRIPFLDPTVFAIAWQLPLSMKIDNGVGKLALRKILYKYVPQKMIERPKSGFAVPIGLWLRGPLRDWADELLDEKRLECSGLFDVASIRRYWTLHRDGRRDFTVKIWNILMMQSWLEAQSCIGLNKGSGM